MRKSGTISLLVALLLVIAVAASMASASSNQISGSMRGPVAATCGPWHEFNFGDDLTAPFAGEFSIKQVSDVATDGARTLDISLKISDLNPGVVTVSGNVFIVAHGFGGCTPDVKVGDARIDKHGRMRNAHFSFTWTPSPYHYPEIGFCTGINTCFRTGPIYALNG